MRTSFRIVLLIVTLLVSGTSPGVFAEDDEDLPELDYYQGQIEQSYLPYFRKFAITGSTKLPEGDADAVQLRIQRANKDKDDEKAVYYWVRPKTHTTTSFRIIVRPLRSLGQKYDLVFTFYIRPSQNDKTITKIVNTTLDSLDTYFHRDGELRLNTAESTLVKVTESVLNARPDYDQRELHHLVNRKGIYTVEPRAPAYAFDDSASEWIFGVSIAKDQYEKKEKALKKAKKELEEFERENAKGIEKLLERLDAEVAAATTSEMRSARRDDVEELKKARKNPEEAPGPLDDPEEPSLTDMFLKDKDKWKKEIREVDGVDVLGGLISAIHGVDYSASKLEEARAKRDGLTTDGTRTEMEGRLKEDVSRSLQNFFVEQSVFKTSDPSWVAPTEIDRITIGTTYGFGAIVFNGEDGDDTDLFSYVGLKFYMGPVDKRIEDRYPTWQSHWAITLGAIMGDIAYSDQKMQDAIGSIKPVVGLSYDVMLPPVNHAIGFNAGAVFYRQPNVNTLATADTKVKAGFYFGTTFDLDVLNRIKDLKKD